MEQAKWHYDMKTLYDSQKALNWLIIMLLLIFWRDLKDEWNFSEEDDLWINGQYIR